MDRDCTDDRTARVSNARRDQLRKFWRWAVTAVNLPRREIEFPDTRLRPEAGARLPYVLGALPIPFGMDVHATALLGCQHVGGADSAPKQEISSSFPAEHHHLGIPLHGLGRIGRRMSGRENTRGCDGGALRAGYVIVTVRWGGIKR
jgi:hypothetical protein